MAIPTYKLKINLAFLLPSSLGVEVGGFYTEHRTERQDVYLIFTNTLRYMGDYTQYLTVSSSGGNSVPLILPPPPPPLILISI